MSDNKHVSPTSLTTSLVCKLVYGEHCMFANELPTNVYIFRYICTALIGTA